MLSTAVRAHGLPAIGGGGGHGQPGLAHGVLDLDVEEERVSLEWVQPGRHQHPVRFVLDGLPVPPPQEAVDGVILVRFGQGNLVFVPVERIGSVGEPVGPRDQGCAVCAVAHRIERVGLEDVPVAHGVLADSAADLHDGGPVRTRGDVELFTGRGEAHGAPFCAWTCSGARGGQRAQALR